MRVVTSAALLLLIAGCDNGPKIIPIDTAPVTGTATFQGKPLEDYRIYFYAKEHAAQEPAVGRADKDGKFALSIRDRQGAIIGPNQVWLIYEPHMPDQVPGLEKAIPVPPAKVDLPQKFRSADTSGLVIEVPKEGLHNYKLELK
ncbi:MAG TPA: hypothetical protein VM510_01645 [Caulifigura sp.]|jgi:hypothetical protein|nr:hypothetical protein [Caulifigura sp.]